jgi:hypothetical protein
MNTLTESPRTYEEFLAQPNIVRVIASMRDCSLPYPEDHIKIGCLTTWCNKLQSQVEKLREENARLYRRLDRAEKKHIDESEGQLARRQFSKVGGSVHE